MNKRKSKETQEVQQYQVGDTIQIKGLDYRVVEVTSNGYHVKNINPPFNSFIYVQGLDTVQEESANQVNADKLEEIRIKHQEAFDTYKLKVIRELDKNAPDLLYRPDDRISL